MEIIPALSAAFADDPSEFGASEIPADQSGVMLEWSTGLLGVAAGGRMNAVRLSSDQLLAIGGAMVARAIIDGADPARAAMLLDGRVAAEIEQLTGGTLPRAARHSEVAGHA